MQYRVPPVKLSARQTSNFNIFVESRVFIKSVAGGCYYGWHHIPRKR
jgi:hypothetical protein